MPAHIQSYLYVYTHTYIETEREHVHIYMYTNADMNMMLGFGWTIMRCSLLYAQVIVNALPTHLLLSPIRITNHHTLFLFDRILCQTHFLVFSSPQNITQSSSSPPSRSCWRNCNTSSTGGPLSRKHSSPLRRLLVVVFAEPTKAVLRSMTTALAWNAPAVGVPLQSTIVAPARRNRSRRGR